MNKPGLPPVSVRETLFPYSLLSGKPYQKFVLLDLSDNLLNQSLILVLIVGIKKSYVVAHNFKYQ
jgi:hypothetical protein